MIQRYTRAIYYKENKNNFFNILYVNVTNDNFDSLKILVNKSVLKKRKQISEDNLFSARQGTELEKYVKAKKREVRKKRYENPELHEKMKKSNREAKKCRFESIQGTELHEKNKKNDREAKKSKLESIKGTELHEKIKKNDREAKKSVFNSIKGTELHEKNKRIDREAKKNKLESIRGTELHEKIKEKQRNAKNVADRIKAFKTLIQDGPRYICVCCNRCLYKRSIILFSEDKYMNLDHVLQNEIAQSFDGRIYICSTCHKKMLKVKFPASQFQINYSCFHILVN